MARWLRLFKPLEGQGRSTRHVQQLGRFRASFSQPASFLISTVRTQEAAPSLGMGSTASGRLQCDWVSVNHRLPRTSQ